MIPYVELQAVEARPMGLWEARYKGIQVDKLPEEAMRYGPPKDPIDVRDIKGYLVQYPDGSKKWVREYDFERWFTRICQEIYTDGTSEFPTQISELLTEIFTLTSEDYALPLRVAAFRLVTGDCFHFWSTSGQIADALKAIRDAAALLPSNLPRVETK